MNFAFYYSALKGKLAKNNWKKRREMVNFSWCFTRNPKFPLNKTASSQIPFIHYEQVCCILTKKKAIS